MKLRYANIAIAGLEQVTAHGANLNNIANNSEFEGLVLTLTQYLQHDAGTFFAAQFINGFLRCHAADCNTIDFGY